MPSIRYIASLAVLVLTASSLLAQSPQIVGVGSVIDGDTIEIHGQRIRLFGIDAPGGRPVLRSILERPLAVRAAGKLRAGRSDGTREGDLPTTRH